MIQAKLTGIANFRLFPNDYLLHRLPGRPEFQHMAPQRELLQEIGQFYIRMGSLLDTANEDQVRDELINKVLAALGHHFLTNQTLATGATPDYIFFRDERTKNEKRLDLAIAVGDAKAPGTNFEKVQGGRSPVRQVYDYMSDTQTQWGILTDGRRWRLLHRNSPTDCHLEVDLYDVVKRNDTDEWLFFYNLFKREAFVAVGDTCLLDRIKAEALKYEQEVGAGLKERVYSALRELAQGFASWPENKLDPSKPEVRSEIRDGCFILLYRLLFIFYAEAGNLLPKDSENYSKLSLEAMRGKVKGASRDDAGFLEDSRALWTGLRDLFRLIDQGKKELGIPPYNGGLFGRGSSGLPRADFLDRFDISDRFLARAVDYLGTVPSLEDPHEFANVDYAGLEIRHLGTIYEGLLEYQLAYAETDLASATQKGGEVWVPIAEYHGRPPLERLPRDRKVRARELYLETERHERKTSGSYYTPEIIVTFVVRETLGPLVDELRRGAESDGHPLSDAILGLRILDPAMGSGHFLVGAMEYLAQRLLEAIQLDVEAGRIKPEQAGQRDLTWAKREVVSHCIFGVDLNELAVELAKVSLWLSTISKEKPLTFLDHRLKRGNSLLGARLSDLRNYPIPGDELAADKSVAAVPDFIPHIFVDKLIAKVQELEKLKDDRIEDIKKKSGILHEFQALPEYQKTRAISDVHTSVYFGNEVAPTGTRDSKSVYFDLVYSLDYPSNWRPLTNTSWFKAASQMADELAFFHWELEFPDVFLGNGSKGGKSGFDAVIGNPPYVSFGLGRVGKLNKLEEGFLRDRYRSSAQYKISTYALFMEQALNLTRPGGYQSLILPDSFLVGRYFSKIRGLILSNTLVGLVHFDEDFWEAGNVGFPVIWIGKKGKPEMDDQYFAATFAPTLDSMVTGKVTTREIDRTLPIKNRRLRIRLIRDSKAAEVVEKVEQSPDILASLVSFHHGIRSKVGRDNIVTRSPPPSEGAWKRGLVESDQVTRFHVDYRGDYILVDPSLLFSGGWDPKDIEIGKILVRRTGDEIIAAFDPDRYYHTNALIYGNALVGDPQKTLRFVCGVLNSRLFNYYYRAVTAKEGRAFPQVEIDALEELVVPQLGVLDQSTSDVHRQAGERLVEYTDHRLIEDARQLLQSLRDARNGALQEVLIHLVVTIESKEGARASKVREFLNWLRVATGSEFDNWTGRTVLYEPWSRSCQEFVEFLTANEERSRLRPAKRASDLQTLQTNYDAAFAEVRKLNSGIESLRLLVDRVVYMLYGVGIRQVATVERISEPEAGDKYGWQS